MKLLAIETSSEHASVALLSGQQVLEYTLEGHANHSERLLPTIQALLAEGEIPLRTLDAIVFGAGPGAFTGLRLACAAAQGLAMGADLGVVDVCGLDALCLHGDGNSVLVASDARMGEVYTAAYRLVDGRPERLGEVRCVPPDLLSAPDDTSTWFGVGSGFAAYKATLEPLISTRLSGVRSDARVLASDLARLAVHRIQAGALLNPECASPIYVRNKVAMTTAERLAQGGRA